MARNVTVDQFAAELLMSAVEVLPEAAKAVKKAAQTVKDEARANVLQTAPTHNAGAHRAITYDEPTVTGTQVGTEVGYDRDLRGGPLGNLLEYGGGGDKSPAHRDIGRAVDDEEPRFEDALRRAAGRLL
jgi:hypothetical protein